MKTHRDVETAPAHHRANDRLLTFEEVCERTKMTEATVRWKRHKGQMPFLFRMGRHVVGWESDTLDWIEQCRAAEADA